MPAKFIVLFFIAVATSAQAQQGAAPVRVGTAEQRTITTEIVAPGTVVSRSDATVSAEVTGQLHTVADVGTAVEAGDVIATIEDRPSRLREADLLAQTAREEARIDFLEKEAGRLQRLAAKNSAAQTQLDQVTSDLGVSQADLAAARARLDLIRTELYKTKIRAPFPGVVVERIAMPGEQVTSGTPVVRVVDPNRLEVVARVPLDYFDFLPPGTAVSVQHNERVQSGTVRSRVAMGDLNTHQFEIRIDIEGGSQPVGQPVRVRLPASEPQTVLAVHRDALVLRPGSVAVFIVGEDQTAHRMPVQTGLAAGEHIQIEGEVRAGDQVVLRGNERLRDGQQVSIIDPDNSA